MNEYQKLLEDYKYAQHCFENADEAHIEATIYRLRELEELIGNYHKGGRNRERWHRLT